MSAGYTQKCSDQRYEPIACLFGPLLCKQTERKKKNHNGKNSENVALFFFRGEMSEARAFELWVRQTLIKLYIEPGDYVCEFMCGKLSDLSKYEKAQIGRFVGIGKCALQLLLQQFAFNSFSILMVHRYN